MQKTFMKITTTLAVMALVIMPAFILVVAPAQALDAGITKVEDNIGLSSTKTPVEIATSIVNIALSFLGIVAVIIILLGGFKWMTAGGNEEKVEEAQKLIRAGIIGLIIIIAAWGIASFVIEKAVSSTGGTVAT